MSKHTVKDFKQSVSETIAKDILLDELDEQGHPVMVEDVIFWALDFYHKNYDKGHNTWGKTIAFTIVERIKEGENKAIDRDRWSRGLDKE